MKQIIRVGKLIDGTGAIPKANMELVIEGNRIVDVKPSNVLTHEVENAKVYNYPDLVAMPGIIDCHDHLAHLGLDLNQRMNTPPSLAVLQAGKWVTQTLMNGITSVRDAGGLDLGVKMAVEQGIIPGPRLFISLVIISQTGGHGDLTQPCGLSEDFPTLPGVPDGIADGVEGVRRKVRDVIRWGADCIKVATTGGVGSPRGGPTIGQFTLEELNAIVDEAHRAKKPVLVHAHGGEGLRMCIEAGVDSIEHGAYATDADLKLMAERGIWLVPTLSVSYRMLELMEHDPRSLPAYTSERLPAIAEARRKSFKRAVELGVPIAMGTDAGALGHGRNTEELVYMVKSGMTPMQAIIASTKMAARLLGMGDQLGTLEPGRLADIVLLDGDPLADISVVANPDRLAMVMKDGVTYKSLGTCGN